MEKNHCKLANWDVMHLANAPHRTVENAAEKILGSGGMAATFGLSVRRAQFELLDARDSGAGDNQRHRPRTGLGGRKERTAR
jgi:hypothetical protein